MRLRTWTVVFLLLHNLLSTAEGALKKRINYQPTFMSADDVVSYFKSFISKTSSYARINEAYYTESFSEDLYHKIDNFISSPQYIKWLMKIKEITDKTNPRGATLDSYQSALNAPCNNLTVFTPTLPAIMRNWVGEKTLVLNDLEAWISSNKKMPPSEMCNRFKGLTCQNKIALDPEIDQGKSVEPTNYTTCQCAQDPSNVGFFKPAQRKKDYAELAYPPACYVRPWRPCHYLSMDATFRNHYYDWHKDLENEKRILAQMMFPVGRTHRCKEDTVCLDMIPGMKRPVCWCNANSVDKTCNTPGKYKVPVGSELMNIRKNFVQIIINANDTTSTCTPEHNTQVLTLVKFAGKDPTRTGAMEVMKQLADKSSKARICDFRADLMCNPDVRTCRGNLNCDQGKIHVGMGVCVVENGFPCQTDEECVSNAKCKHFKGLAESACVCQEGYGEKCEFKKAAFFGSRFLPIISGFREEKFLKLQVDINSVLESWEHTMSLMEGDSCDPSADKNALELVKFFGSLEEYDEDKGTNMLRMAHQITREISRSCRYSNFLHCDMITSRCVPIHGRKVLSSKPDPLGGPKVVVEVGHDEKCVMEMPPVFHSVVNLVCPRGYFCKKGRMDGTCSPDCDSVFAPQNECPKGPATLIPEKSNLANEDPDAQVLPREAPDVDTTTVVDGKDPEDDRQKTLVDNEIEESQKDSLSSVLMNENAAPNEISEPENKEKNDMTKIESGIPNPPVVVTQNDLGGKAPNDIGEDTQNNLEVVTQDDLEEAQNDVGGDVQNDLGGDTQNAMEEDSQNDSEEDTQNDFVGDTQSTKQENDQNEITGRNLHCSSDEIIDPNNSTLCIACPNGSEPYQNSTVCNCLPGYTPEPAGTCKKCPIGNIPDVSNPTMCIICPNGQVPDSINNASVCMDCGPNEVTGVDHDLCQKCSPDKEPDTSLTTCVCKVPGQIPDSSGTCNFPPTTVAGAPVPTVSVTTPAPIVSVTTPTPTVNVTTSDPVSNGTSTDGSSTTDGMTMTTSTDNSTGTYPTSGPYPSTRPPTGPDPPTRPPPRPSVGSPCISSGDCGANTNLVCKDRKCECLMGLIANDGPGGVKQCKIPLDHLCGENGLKALQSKNPGQPIRKQAVCTVGTTCSKVNDGMYCRQNKDDGYIIVSHAKKGNKNNGNTISMELARGWKQLSALVMGIMLTAPHIRITFL